MKKTQYSNLWLNELAKHHTQWVNLVRGLGGDMYAEDIVQEMYIKIHNIADKRGSHDFLFEDGNLQKGYIFFTLRSILYTYLAQRSKHRKNPIEWLINNLEKDKEENPITFGQLADDGYIYDEQGSSERSEAEERFYNKVYLETQKWDEYDRDIFNIYKNTNMSFRTMSKYMGISFTNIFHTVKRCKERLKESLGDDWEDLQNEDYELI